VPVPSVDQSINALVNVGDRGIDEAFQIDQFRRPISKAGVIGASEAETVAGTFRGKFDGTDFEHSTATAISSYVPDR
jgi:hypothetical protein